MDMNNSVNPSSDVRVEFNGRSERVAIHPEPPPPYSRHDGTYGAVTNQPILHQSIIIQAQFRDSPMGVDCPTCGQRVITNVKYEVTKKTHMLAGFTFGFTLWCCLCCLAAVPYMAKSLQKSYHYCPNCNTLLGQYSKL